MTLFPTLRIWYTKLKKYISVHISKIIFYWFILFHSQLTLWKEKTKQKKVISITKQSSDRVVVIFIIYKISFNS